MNKKILISTLLILNGFCVFSQVKSLTKQEIKTKFNKTFKNKNNIKYDIIKCYPFSDSSGDYYQILTQKKYSEKFNEESQEKESYYKFVKGYIFKIEENTLNKKIEFTDTIDKWEETIYHWTKFTEIKDYDNDGNIDPVFIYGADGDNYCRFRILLYYNGKKTAIRLTDGTLDDSRSIKIDKSFYNLPNSVRKGILELMLKMEGIVTYPYKWKEKINKKQTSFKNGSNG